MDPVARHVVVAGALVRDGRVLLCHRHPDRAWYPDVWDLPGGHLEPGEDAGRALRRELHEELGVRADPDPRPLWSLRSPDMDLTVLRVLGWRGEPSVVDEQEHDALGWFAPAAASALALADPSYPEVMAAAVTGRACGTVHR